jgi:hypothetical protein
MVDLEEISVGVGTGLLLRRKPINRNEEISTEGCPRRPSHTRYFVARSVRAFSGPIAIRCGIRRMRTDEEGKWRRWTRDGGYGFDEDLSTQRC